MSRQESEALLATRRELGPEYEEALVASFAERVERAVAGRQEASAADTRGVDRVDEGARIRQFVLGLVSLGVGVPITIVPVTTQGTEALAAVVVAWGGITVVNVAHALTVRPRRWSRRR